MVKKNVILIRRNKIKMRVLTLEIIVWIIASVYFILTPHLASSTLAGSSYSICERGIERTEVQEESYIKWGWKWWWKFPYFWLDTEIKSVNKSIYTREQICCQGFTNINQTCLPEQKIKSYQEYCSVGCVWSKVPQSISNLKECSIIVVDFKYASKNSKKLSEVCNHDKNCKASFFYPCSPKCESSCENGWCTNYEVCACPSNFRIDNTGTKCVSLCDENCEHGHCVAKNKCDCTEGWEGAFCDVAVLCRLVENDEKNSEFSDEWTDYWKLPICHSGCREKINATMIRDRPTISINSTCNAEVMGFLIINGQWIFLPSLLIVLACFITCIAYYIEKMKKSVNPSNDLELIPSTTTSHNMEENDYYYDEIKTTF